MSTFEHISRGSAHQLPYPQPFVDSLASEHFDERAGRNHIATELPLARRLSNR
jgi:hypothetical protein